MSPVADVIAPALTNTPRFCWEPVPEVPVTVIVPVPVEEILLLEDSIRTPSFPVPVVAVEPMPVTLMEPAPVEEIDPAETK